MKKKHLEKTIEFIYELGSLRHIKRTWVNFLNPDFQNVTEHHFRVTWLAILIAKEENVKDIEKVMKMALIHDIPESRTGDVNYLQRQYVTRNEDLAMKDIVHHTNIEDELISLLEEYTQLKNIEAKVVKDADNLDVDFEILEQSVKGFQFPKEWITGRKHVAENKLYTKTAKQIWKSLQKSNPHAWHVNGRNRFSSGDWKK